MTFGTFLKLRRMEAGISQTELSFRTRIPQKNISNWENGKVDPDLRFIEKLAVELGFDLPWMDEDRVGATRRYPESVASEAA